MSSWKDTLRTPMGQLRLALATLAGSVVLGAVLASQTAWFETLVREKYGEPGAGDAALAGQLIRGGSSRLSDRQLEALYRQWMRPDVPDPKLAVPLVAANPDWVHQRVERTLLAGTPSQKERAVQLAVDGGLPNARPLLIEAIARVKRMGPPEALVVLERGLAAL